jgi:hypothetical protein
MGFFSTLLVVNAGRLARLSNGLGVTGVSRRHIALLAAIVCHVEHLVKSMLFYLVQFRSTTSGRLKVCCSTN